MNNQMYCVVVSERRIKELAGELIDARFTFSSSYNGGIKVNIDVENASRVREFCIILHRLGAHANNGVIAEVLPPANFTPPFFNKDGSRVDSAPVRL